MLRIAVLLLALTFVLGGCAGTRTFRPTDEGFTRRHIDGRSGRVVLADGRGFDARSLRVTPDSVVWAVGAAPGLFGVPIAEVARLRVESPRLTVGRTALAGVVVSAAIGAAVAARLVHVFGGTPDDLLSVMPFVAAIAVPSGVFYGSLGGAIAPATWTFVPESPPSVVPDTSRSFAAPRLAP